MPAPAQLLHLLHLASPALPVGGFHFSQGLEYAVHAGWMHDEASALDWIAGLAAEAMGTLDLPVLARLHRALLNNDDDQFARWNAFLLASRETYELRAEDRHIGSALARILKDLGHPVRINGDLTYAGALALACNYWKIDEHAALQTYAWVWAENQTLAAIKLVPLGQTAGQRILQALIPVLADAAATARTLHNHEIRISTLMQGVASTLHETQYTRLFRS